MSTIRAFYFMNGISMAQTYAQLQKQISALEAEAEKLKSSEVPGAIGKIKDLVAAYGITATDIFGAKALKGGGVKRSTAGRAKYSDANGNTWVGMGKRPQWIRDALAEGRTIDEFASDAAVKAKRAGKTPAAKKVTTKRRKGAGKAKYREGDRSWSGFGPQPGWLKDAISQGKSLEDFQV